jgi:uncharacterized protein YfaP (DUF2135 family)
MTRSWSSSGSIIARAAVVLALLAGAEIASAAPARIISPRGGYITRQTVEVSGTAPDEVTRATLLVNGIPQDIPVTRGSFSVRVVVAPGTNLVELVAGGERDRVSFYAKVPARDIKIVLTWDSARFVDLWVINPKGEKCYWASPSVPSGGNLVANDETGFGPQIFTMEKALPGSYSIQAQYYAPGPAPVTRVKLYIILFEGTRHETVETHQFIMTRPQSIYHITDLFIDDAQLGGAAE